MTLEIQLSLCVCVCAQVQATVVGFLASIAAVIFSWIPEGHFRLSHAVLLCASSVATAFIASLLLGMTKMVQMLGLRPAADRMHVGQLMFALMDEITRLTETPQDSS